MMDRTLDMIIAILGILKAGMAYVPMGAGQPEERLKSIIDDACMEVLISEKKYVRKLNGLQWECESLRTFLCMDAEDVYREDRGEEKEIADRVKLWEYVGETATDEITGGGWLSSYTGLPFRGKRWTSMGIIR